METFAVWRKENTYLVAAETPIRAIQAAILAIGGFARDYNVAPLSIYSDKVQDKIRANSRVIWKRGIKMNDNETLAPAETWQTQSRGTNDQEYQIYVACAESLGWAVKSYDEWLQS